MTTRTVLEGMMAMSIAGLMVTAAGRLRADEPKKPVPGIYIEKAGESGSDGLTRLPGARPQEVKTKGMGKMILTQGLVKASMMVALAGTIADLRTSDSSPAFVISLPDPAAAGQAPADPFAAMNQSMSGDSMPPGARTGADFQLVQLTVTSDSRQADMGKLGAQGGRLKNSIDLSEERVAPGEYRMRPKQSLKPGEYAFFFQNSMSGAGGYQAWAFGVDAPK